MRQSCAFLSASLAVISALAATPSPAAEPDAPIGWAAVEGGTQGGAGGETVTVADAGALKMQARGNEPRVIRVQGTIHLDAPVFVGSRKTIVGVGGDAGLVGGGLVCSGVSQVIIRNLTIKDTAEDAIGIDSGAHHIWVDHCDLSHCRDGLLDIKQGSDFVTVSWTRFHDHVKTCLLGHSDRPADERVDRGHLRVSYHHNYFDGSRTRHPRVRFGEPVHVFNNYFLNNEYGVASVMDAGVLVEGNYFEKVRNPTHIMYGDSPAPGRLVEQQNVYKESGAPATRGTVAEPRRSYAYTLDAAEAVPELVRKGAGVGKLPGD